MSLKLSYLQRTLWLYFIAILMILMGGVTSASMPPVGYIIGNQASAEYQVEGQTFKVTSNLVQTIIAQKGALTLTNNQTTTATPGLTVYFSHQITNTGNGNDHYNLTTTVISGGLTNVAVYPDLNADGIPDQTTTPITVTPILTQGEAYNVVVMATLPSSASVSSTGSLNIKATSVFDSAQTQTNTDTITTTNGAVLRVTNGFNKNVANPGDTLSVTFTYENVGNQTAGKTQIKDLLPAGLTYVAGSGTWSINPNGPSAALDDTNASNPSSPNGGISYLYTSGSNLVTVTLPQVPINQVVTVSFNVIVAAGTAPGVINNYGTVDYNATGGSNLPGSPTPTNYAEITVNAVPGVVVTDQRSTTDQDGTTNGTVTLGLIYPVYEGSAILFDNVIQNTGNGTDTFNITIPTNTFPAGTSFTLTKSDGITPLTDSNNDGEVDTGPLSAGQSYHVFLRVQLPPGSAGGPYMATKTATSITSASVTASVIDRVNAVTAALVDLTNTATRVLGGDSGWGVGPESTPQKIITTYPDTTATFDLYINQTASVIGSYILQYSNNSSFTNATTNVMPTGWSVQFYDATTNALITSATLPATNGSTASQYHYKAVVTIPSTALAGNQAVYFRAYSPALNIGDITYDQVTVNAVNDLAIQPGHTGEVHSGGAIIYNHILQNLGNETQTLGAITLSDSSSSSGWTSIAYLDANNNGVYDPGTDPVFTNISQISGGLQPFASVNVFVKVQAPLGALAGVSNVTTLTLPTDSNMVNNTVTNQTTVISGNVSMLKEQFPDPTCSTTPANSLAFQTAPITTIQPGQCVIYRITATNNGVSPVTQLQISDTAPNYTTIDVVVTAGGTAASPVINNGGSVGSSGTLQVTWATVNPGQTAIMYYRVKLNNS